MSSNVSSATSDWVSAVPRLRIWYRAYLGTWLGGAAVAVAGLAVGESNTSVSGFLVMTGAVSFFGSVIPYLVSMVFAYQVQAGLKEAGYINSGAWQIVVAGLILNPYVLGFYPPASVLSAAKAAQRNA